MTAALIALAVIIVFGGGVALLADLAAHPRLGGSVPGSDRISNSSQASATAGVVGTVTVVSGATSIPGATPTGTITPAPSATHSPPPPLSLGALHLKREHGGQCSGSQIIRNSGVQRITWQWSSVQPSAPPTLVYGVNTSARSGGFLLDLNPGVAPGRTDTLNVEMKCGGQSYTVTLRDGVGRTQQFTMTSD